MEINLSYDQLPDGSMVWAKIVGFLTDEYLDGKQVAYTTMIDVTDLMQMQKERSIAYDNIPGFIIKHRILPDGIAMIDASEQVEDIFDVSLGEITTRDPFAVLAEESQRPPYMQRINMAATGGSISTAPVSIRFPMIRCT